MSVDLIKLRREFTSNGITRAELNSSPFVQFEAWIEQATQAELTLPNAMSLATAGSDEVRIDGTPC